MTPRESADDARADAGLHADGAEEVLEEGGDELAPLLEAVARAQLATASRLGQLAATIETMTETLARIVARLEPPG